MRTYTLGQKVTFTTDEFDGKTTMNATITEVHDDYATATTDDGIVLWIDKDTEHLFD